MDEVEQSVIDEDELQRQLEEELANMNYQPDPDDLLERQSNYSIFNQSTTNFNNIDASMNNVDDYNQDENNVVDQNYENVILEEVEEQQPYQIPQLILSDDLLIQSYANQQQQHEQEQLENQILRSSEKHQQKDKINLSISESFGKFEDDAQELIGKKQDMLDRINIVSQGVRQMQEYELEMERLFMEREDKVSRQIEEYNHRLKFIQKDMTPPLLPPYLTQSDNPLKNKPVQKTPIPGAPMTDNFVKYRVNFQNSLPVKVNLSTVKILWSRQKQEEEEEKNRAEEIRIQREKNHQRLCDLLKFTKDTQNDSINNIKQLQPAQQQGDQLLKLIQTNKNNVKSDTITSLKEEEITIKVSIVGKDPKLYDNSDKIYKYHQLKQHSELQSNLIKLIPSLEKSMPSLKESQDPRPKVTKDIKAKQRKQNRGGDDFMNLPDMNQDDSELSQALALHASNPIKTEKIEIKNEQFANLELQSFTNYKNLMQLNLSMNKIVTISGTIDCPFLNFLKLSDNVIKDIPSQIFTKCKNLKTLQIDINKITKLQNLQHLTQLEELNVSNNQIQSLDGIQSLANLRRLNFSFNKLTSIDTHLNNLTLLEYLELGKNFISNIDKFPSHKMLFLTELYLYSNQLVQVPKNFSIPQLRILNLNRNQDLHQLVIGYCPLLEQLSASYCSLVQIKQLSGCPNMRELDISFNSINSLEGFIQIIAYNAQLRMIRFSDNPFSVNKDNHFSEIFKRKFVYLERVNGENVNQNLVQSNNSDQALNFKVADWSRLDQLSNNSMMLRQFITKIMSQKIRITFFSTTFILRYMKNMLPLLMLKSITNNHKNSFLPQADMAFLYENHMYVQNLRKSVRVITSYLRMRRFKRKALIKKMSKHVDKICKIQALMRGHLVRQKNAAIITRIKRDGPKKTKKYQMISKLQANIKGFLFRKRRIRALVKLKESKQSYEDDFEEFDAESFFGIKEEVLQNGLSLPQEQMMQQMIQMMAMQSQQIRQSKQPIPQQTMNDSSGVKFPPINQKNATHSNINELIKPKTMRKQGSNRPPSARSSNAISEIDMNTDSQSLQNKANMLMRKNNLMNQTQNSNNLPSINSNGNQSRFDDQQSERQSMYSMNSNPFYPTQAQVYRQKMVEEKKQDIIKTQEVIDEWGFQNEETKKMFEARMKKKNHGKKKQLTAEEKLLKFRALNKK